MISSRRAFLGGLAASLLAGPAIVRAGSIMPISSKLILEDITVWSSNQTGYQLSVNPLQMGLQVGDVFTIDGVFALNRISKLPTEHLRQFVVTANAEEKHRILSIYPGIIPAHVDEHYATVDAPPKNNAKVRLVAWN